jgi:hypothetical protein
MVDHSEKQLTLLALEFLGLQQSLLMAWRSANPESSDLQLLLDFPKRSVVTIGGQKWDAIKHGLGVRFTNPDRVIVDIPRAIDQPSALDANRLFDFHQSRALGTFPRVPKERDAFYTLFDQLCALGIMAQRQAGLDDGLFIIREPATS